MKHAISWTWLTNPNLSPSRFPLNFGTHKNILHIIECCWLLNLERLTNFELLVQSPWKPCLVVAVLRSTPYHTPLKYRCLIKKCNRVGPVCLIWVLVWRVVCQSDCRFVRFHVTVGQRWIEGCLLTCKRHRGLQILIQWRIKKERFAMFWTMSKQMSGYDVWNICWSWNYPWFVIAMGCLVCFWTYRWVRVTDKSRLLSSLHFVITPFLLRLVVLRSANSRLVLFVPIWLLTPCPPHPDAWMWFSSCRNAVTIVTTSQHTVPQWNRFFNR